MNVKFIPTYLNNLKLFNEIFKNINTYEITKMLC